MTQTLIEQLEALKRHGEKEWWGETAMGITPYGEYVLHRDLRAIIEQHKREVAEPVCFAEQGNIDMSGYDNLSFSYPVSTKPTENRTVPLYANPQPDIVAELVKALNWAIENVDMKSVQMDSAKYDALNRARSTLVDARYKVKGMMG